MKTGRLLLAALAATCLAANAHARQWPRVGSWQITEANESCAASLQYGGKGSTELVIFVPFTRNYTALGLSNYGWSSKEDERYKLEFVVDNDSYVGNVRGVLHGFYAQFEPDFIDHLAKAKGITIYRGDVVVDSLSLAGSAAAIAMAKRCAEAMAAAHAVSDMERARLAHIADDPFAEPPAPPPPAEPWPEENTAVPRGDPSRWIEDEYPSEAVAKRQEGTSVSGLTVEMTGRVSACVTLESSGHEILDEWACSLYKRRGRFQGVDGGKYKISHTWKIPPDR